MVNKNWYRGYLLFQGFVFLGEKKEKVKEVEIEGNDGKDDVSPWVKLNLFFFIGFGLENWD